MNGSKGHGVGQPRDEDLQGRNTVRPPLESFKDILAEGGNRCEIKRFAVTTGTDKN